MNQNLIFLALMGGCMSEEGKVKSFFQNVLIKQLSLVVGQS